MPPSHANIITIVLAGIVATWVANDTVLTKWMLPITSASTPTILLKRPAHQIPPALWQLKLAPTATTKTITGPLNATQIASYYDDGFLILPNFFDSYLPSLQSDVEQLIDHLATDLYAAGHVKSTYAQASWTERLLRLTEDYPNAPLVLIKGGVLPTNFQHLYSDSDMLDIANQLGVGPDVAVNAAWNLRAKMKKHEETTVPWHQDNSYWEPRVWDEHVITVWVSLVDARIENGCMQFVQGGHKTGKTASHTIGTTTKTWYTELDEKTMEHDLLDQGINLASRIVTAEVPAGTAIIFPGITPHRSLNSISDKIRWSTDYRLHRRVAARQGFSSSPLDWFYGLKDSLLLRDGKGDASDYVADWSSWANVERTKIQDEGLGTEETAEKFDPVICGPWMDLWNLTTHIDGESNNQHVDRYLSSAAGKRPAGEGYLPDNW